MALGLEQLALCPLRAGWMLLWRNPCLELVPLGEASRTRGDAWWEVGGRWPPRGLC